MRKKQAAHSEAEAPRAVRPRKPKELKPLSLHPMDFDTAIRGFLAVASTKTREEMSNHQQEEQAHARKAGKRKART
jgi:hypothetical protein